jgi:hypothetical protein
LIVLVHDQTIELLSAVNLGLSTYDWDAWIRQMQRSETNAFHRWLESDAYKKHGTKFLERTLGRVGTKPAD